MLLKVFPRTGLLNPPKVPAVAGVAHTGELSDSLLTPGEMPLVFMLPNPGIKAPAARASGIPPPDQLKIWA